MWLQAEDGSLVNLAHVSVVMMRDGKGSIGTNGGKTSEVIASAD